MRRPTVHATKLGDGSTVATVVNWREMSHGEFSFRLGEIGVVRGANDIIFVEDLWSGDQIAKIDSTQSDTIVLKSIPGHGNHTLKFSFGDHSALL